MGLVARRLLSKTTAKKTTVYNSFTDVVDAAHVLNVAFINGNGVVVQLKYMGERLCLVEVHSFDALVHHGKWLLLDFPLL